MAMSALRCSIRKTHVSRAVLITSNTLSKAHRLKFARIGDAIIMTNSVQARYCFRILLCLAYAACATQSATAQGKAGSTRCSNPEANQLLERGRDTMPKGGYGLPAIVATAGQALTYFQLATEKDPTCAAAFVVLARAEIGFPSWPGLPPDERYKRVREAAARAIELQDNLAEAHALVGQVEFSTWQWEPAGKEFRRALELEPKSVAYHLQYGRFLAALGRSNEAIDEAEQARQIAQGSQQIDAAAGEIYYWTRRYDKAVELISPAVGSVPMANFLLGWAYAAEAKWQPAIDAFGAILPQTDRDAGDLMSLAYAYARDGRRSDVPPLLDEVKQKTTLMYVPVYRIAATYLGMGDKEHALEWLEKASTSDRDWMVWLKVDPVMDPLRSDPRFQRLLDNMKFPERATRN